MFMIYGFAMSALLAVLWIGRAVGVMQTGRFPEEYAGISTLASQALDLGVLVPLAASAAVLLWKRSPWGYFLASVTITISR
jgi:hypothetical protein